MYRPSKYDIHNESMNKFVKIFNDCPLFPDIIMFPKKEEDFKCDGYFVNTTTQKKIGYDWELRDRYFSNGVFAFKTLGQYERKIIKPDIEITLQADSTQTAVAVAWHEDYRNENLLNRSLLTDTNKKQFGNTRETSKFWIIRYENVATLKVILHTAFELGYRSYDKTNPNQ